MKILITALAMLSVGVLASTGDLTLVEERTESGREYFEWAIEGVDSLRIVSGFTNTTPGWFFIRQHHSGVWDPLFSFLPIMLKEEGNHWLAKPNMLEALVIAEVDSEFVFGVSLDHGLTHWYGNPIRVPWQNAIPAVHFLGEPGYYSCMSTSALDWEQMTLEELRSALGPSVTDSLMIPFTEFIVHWDRMISSPVLDRDSTAAQDTLRFELSSVGIHGTVSSTTFEIEPVENLQFTVLQRFRWNLFYNEYGCGACWMEQGVPGVWSAWLQLERRGTVFTTLDVYNRVPYTPVLSEEAHAMANAYAERQASHYVVFEGPSQVEFLIRGESASGTAVEKLLVFDIVPGD